MEADDSLDRYASAEIIREALREEREALEAEETAQTRIAELVADLARYRQTIAQAQHRIERTRLRPPIDDCPLDRLPIELITKIVENPRQACRLAQTSRRYRDFFQEMITAVPFSPAQMQRVPCDYLLPAAHHGSATAQHVAFDRIFRECAPELMDQVLTSEALFPELVRFTQNFPSIESYVLNRGGIDRHRLYRTIMGSVANNFVLTWPFKNMPDEHLSYLANEYHVTWNHLVRVPYDEAYFPADMNRAMIFFGVPTHHHVMLLNAHGRLNEFHTTDGLRTWKKMGVTKADLVRMYNSISQLIKKWDARQTCNSFDEAKAEDIRFLTVLKDEFNVSLMDIDQSLKHPRISTRLDEALDAVFV